MNSSRRWLLIFAIVIVVLIIVTVSLVLLAKRNTDTLLPEDTPQGIVQRYLISVKDKDYQQAYNYLLFDTSGQKMTYDEWIRSVSFPQAINLPVWKAILGKTTQNDDNATVDVIFDAFHPGGFLGGSQSSQQIPFILIKTGNSWFITSPTYVYWIY